MSVRVIGLGAAAPLGVRAATLQAESDAGTLRFAATDLTDPRGDPVRAARLALIDEGASRLERMAALLERAAGPAIERAEALKAGLCPVFLALPEAPAGPPPRSDIELLASSLRRLAGADLRLGIEPKHVVRSGRPGFAEALDAAARYLGHNPSTACALVGAVDSLVDPESLAALVAADRVLREGHGGLLPGEGAAFVLLVREQSPTFSALEEEEREGAPRLLGAAFAREPSPFDPKAAGRSGSASGLGQVFASLAASPAAGSRRLRHMVAGHSGERYFHRELAHAALRASELMPDPAAVSIPAASFGELGASTCALGLLLAERALEEIGGEGARVLVYGSGDEGKVGAFVLEAPAAPRSASSASLAAREGAEGGALDDAEELLAFRSSFHEEHLEEAGYFGLDIARDLREGLIPWPALAAAEARLQRQLRALWVDPCFAPEALPPLLLDRDEDLALGAALALIHPRAPASLLPEFLAILPELPEPRLAQVEAMLRRSSHPRLPGLLLPHARSEHAPSAAMAARLVGHLRDDQAFALIRLVEDEELAPEVREAAARSLGRLLPAQAREEAARAIASLLESHPGSVEATAALLAFRHPFGKMHILRKISGLSLKNSRFLRVAGACLDPGEAPLLRAALSLEGALPEALGALAAMGLPEDLELLLSHLEHEEPRVARAAAEGLERITGAGLIETTWLPDEEEGEAEALQVRRASPDRGRWEAAVEQARASLRPGRRHRRGRPFSLLGCAEELEGAYGYDLRAEAAEELRLRSGRRIDFEPDWSIARQQAALATLTAALRAEGAGGAGGSR